MQVTTSYAANAIPVAEYTLATILFSLKHGWQYARRVREQCDFPVVRDMPGCYHSTVGLVSLGIIARTLLKLLKPFDLHVLAYDPHVSQEQAKAMNVELVALDELFARSDVVSIHTPWLEETKGMIRGHHISRMKPGSTLINTARGAVMNDPEMIEALSNAPVRAAGRAGCHPSRTTGCRFAIVPSSQRRSDTAYRRLHGRRMPPHGPLHGRRTATVCARRTAAMGRDARTGRTLQPSPDSTTARKDVS